MGDGLDFEENIFEAIGGHKQGSKFRIQWFWMFPWIVTAPSDVSDVPRKIFLFFFFCRWRLT